MVVDHRDELTGSYLRSSVAVGPRLLNSIAEMREVSPVGKTEPLNVDCSGVELNAALIDERRGILHPFQLG